MYFSTVFTERLVPVSVPGKRFPVSVRFLGHPVNIKQFWPNCFSYFVGSASLASPRLANLGGRFGKF